MRRGRPKGLRRSNGFTLIELLIALAIFSIVISALGWYLVTSARGYGALQTSTESFQDAEAALQLLKHEVGLAGYRGLGSDYDKAFSTADQNSILIELGSTSDSLEIRFFEDDTYLPAGDDGERSIRFFVDEESDTLMRVENGVEYEMVANIASLRVNGYINRNQLTTPVRDAYGNLNPPPEPIAAIDVTLSFSDGTQWTFAIGMSASQQVSAGVTS